jgi:hypothetical protein
VKSNLLIVGVATVAVLVIDYWLFPPWWALALWLGAGLVALLWSIAALRIALRAECGRRRLAAGVLLATIAMLAAVATVRPVARLRIAASAESLADVAASGSLQFGRPKRVGLFDVTSVWVGDDRVTFNLGRNPEDWELELRAKLKREGSGSVRLTDWSWMMSIE